LIQISVVIVTKNEERNIERALESVRDAAEIIVIDSFSSDNTPKICKKYTDKFFQKEWQGYAKQKQDGIDLAANEWVLILDSDEFVTPELKEEILKTVRENKHAGVYIPRKNFFAGKWIKHGGWWPDYTLRLFKKTSGHMEQRAVHEKIVVDGKTAYFKNPINHYTYNSISEFIDKNNVYSTLAAEELGKNNASANILDFTIRPLFTFVKMFFLKLGFMDGMYGLILALLYSYYTFLKYSKVYENKH
jgi:glycosyltransferase involved in cell wall biosynthesis